jgi:hypothetical protein
MEQSLFEKLIVTQPVKKFPSLYGTKMFIMMFTQAHHQSVPSQMITVHNHILCKICFNMSFKWSLPFRFSD